MYRFRAMETRSHIGNRSYGILGQEMSDGAWRSVAFIPDVSSDRELVEEIAEGCTRGQLDPLQLLDVVMDALS